MKTWPMVSRVAQVHICYKIHRNRQNVYSAFQEEVEARGSF